MATGRAGSSIVDRMVRASRLESELYEEVEHDRDANAQAATVVVLTSVAAAVGTGGRVSFGALVLVAIVGLGGWLMYSWLTYLVGTRVLRGPETSADWSEVSRTLAFATAPQSFLVLGVFGAHVLLFIVVSLWVLATTILALRAALDFSTGRAAATALIGWILMRVLYAIFL